MRGSTKECGSDAERDYLAGFRRADLRFPTTTIRLDDYIFSWKPEREGLRQEVLDRVVADFSEHEDEATFEEGVSRLLRVLRKQREGATSP